MVSKQIHMTKEFKKVMTSLRKIPDINRGGCGVSALALFDAAKRDGLKPKIFYLYSWLDDDSYRQNQKFKEGKTKKADSCSHVVVKIEEKYYDSDGIIKQDKIERHTIDKVKRKHLIASINNAEAWNDVFDRWKWIPKIEKFFKPGTKVWA